MGDNATTSPDRPKAAVYQPFECRVESVEPMTASEKLFRLRRLDGRPFGHRPGQFIQVYIEGVGEAPISVSSSPTRGDYLELGVRRVGGLTAALHELRPGQRIGVRGPFGTAFDTEGMAGKDLLLIAGGCGLAPMRALIQHVEDRRDRYGEVTILYGAKSFADVLYRADLETWRHGAGLRCQVTVDRVTEGTCWDGHVGLITTLIAPLALRPERTVAVIVGPPVMYGFVIAELMPKGLKPDDIVVSLERYMRCGVGKCGHCTIDHLYCCMDGPVFKLSQVASLAGAL